jgi:hypothetical protein
MSTTPNLALFKPSLDKLQALERELISYMIERLEPYAKEQRAATPCLEEGTAMDEKQNPSSTPDIADLTALVEELIAYWKELGRKRFHSHPGVDPDAFERLWPQILDNFFLAETVRVAKKLRFLSRGRDN